MRNGAAAPHIISPPAALRFAAQEKPVTTAFERATLSIISAIVVDEAAWVSGTDFPQQVTFFPCYRAICLNLDSPKNRCMSQMRASNFTKSYSFYVIHNIMNDVNELRYQRKTLALLAFRIGNGFRKKNYCLWVAAIICPRPP